jgi:RNA polymerase sigma-70 factor (ECF subfamily)
LDGTREAAMKAALEQAILGDNLAFAEIVREYQGTVFSIAHHYLRNRSLAEELAQDIFLQLYQNLARIQSAAHLVYWLRRVTVNRCIDHGRRVKPESGMDDAPEPSVTPHLADPFLDERLRASVASLPEKWRMMVILRYQEEMDVAEISQLMDVPLNTVKSGLQRALAELRKKLSRKLGEMRYAIF